MKKTNLLLPVIIILLAIVAIALLYSKDRYSFTISDGTVFYILDKQTGQLYTTALGNMQKDKKEIWIRFNPTKNGRYFDLDIAKKADKPIKKWSEIANDPVFQSMSTGEQQKVRAAYFDKINEDPKFQSLPQEGQIREKELIFGKQPSATEDNTKQ